MKKYAKVVLLFQFNDDMQRTINKDEKNDSK